MAPRTVNMHPCWWGPGFFPGARRSDASLWGPGFGHAMAHVCGDWVVVGALAATLGQMRGNLLVLAAAGICILHQLQASSDADLCGPACSSSQTVETEPEPGYQMSMRLAAYAMAHSRQPLPPTSFSLQLLKADMSMIPMRCMAQVTPMQRMAPTKPCSPESHATHGPS